MKTFVGLTCFGLLTYSIGIVRGAEEPGSRMLAFGVQGGMSFANAQTPADISSSTKTGFMGGLNLNVGISRVLSIQPELLYVQRGSNLVDVAGVRATLKQDSIEIPLFLRASLGGSVGPYLLLGPVAIFNVSNRLETDISGNKGAIAYNPKSYDIAAAAGFGLEFGPVFTNLRYSMGLVDTDEAGTNWKTRGVQLLLGLTFGT